MKLLDKIFHRKAKLTNEQLVIVQLSDEIQELQTHIIALARIAFIKPEALRREVENTEKNLEYLKKLIELRDKKA